MVVFFSKCNPISFLVFLCRFDVCYSRSWFNKFIVHNFFLQLFFFGLLYFGWYFFDHFLFYIQVILFLDFFFLKVMRDLVSLGLRSELSCSSCKYQSSHGERNYNLVLPLGSTLVPCTVQDLLDEYFQPETVDLDHSCPAGASPQKAYEFVSAPEVLAIQLQRFPVYTGNKNRRSVNVVDHPTLSFTLQNGETCEYELETLVAHRGDTFFNGHYVAYMKRDGRWILGDDLTVTEFSPRLSSVAEADMTSNCYLLFYSKITPETRNNLESIESSGSVADQVRFLFLSVFSFVCITFLISWLDVQFYM